MTNRQMIIMKREGGGKSVRLTCLDDQEDDNDLQCLHGLLVLRHVNPC